MLHEERISKGTRNRGKDANEMEKRKRKKRRKNTVIQSSTRMQWISSLPVISEPIA